MIMNLIFSIIITVVAFGSGVLYTAYFIANKANEVFTADEKITFKNLMRKIYK